MPPDLLVPPRYSSVPTYSTTSGEDVADLCEIVDYAPDPNQRAILDAIFGEDDRGRPSAFETAIVCSRQNLKTAIMKQACLGYLFLLGRKKIVYTAHEWNPAVKAMFDEMVDLVSHPVLKKRVADIRVANGEQRIKLHSGAEMLFKTRMNNSGRALAADVVLLDEGFAVQEDHLGSLVPLLSTRPDAQLIWGSSPGKSFSAALRAVRDRGRARNDPSLAYFEWCAPDPAEACELGEKCDHGKRTPGCACDNPEMWRLANPTMGIRIAEEYIRKERRTLSPREFARERMGWWDDPADASEPPPIDKDRWGDLVDYTDEPSDDDPSFELVSFAVEVDRDQKFASISAAGPRDDGRVHVELMQRGRGTGWVAARAREIDDENGGGVWVVDGGGPAERLIQALEDEGLNVIVAGTSDVAAAAAALVEMVDNGTLVHGPQDELDEAVEGARKRHFRDGGWTFGRIKSDTDVTPLVGCGLAAWGIDQTGGPNLW